MMDNMKRMITGQGLEEENGETGDQVARREETKKGEPVMTPGSILTEESRKGKETAERSVRRYGHRYRDGGRAWDGRGGNW